MQAYTIVASDAMALTLLEEKVYMSLESAENQLRSIEKRFRIMYEIIELDVVP